jgi:hypothetical protein
MTKFFSAAFAAGAAALVWIAAGFAASSWLGLAMTALIAAVYLLGAFELRQFRGATRALDQLLDATQHAPATLGEWLQQVPDSLRDAVRLRVQGERGALPGAALTSYLVGLLVMLGMLGTFLGMVVTFKGTVFALERSTDLQAMRTALADPIRGLGLSFGTSVGGVAASAMLGLMAAIARRERLEVARKLEALIAGVLLPFSLVHQRQESFHAIQLQSRALPALALKLEALMDRIERRGEQLDAQLLERQGALQRELTTAYTRLAQDVGVSLKDSIGASAQAASDAIRPVAESTMAQVAQQTERLHARLGEVAKGQVEAIATQFSATAQGVAKTFEDAIARAHTAQTDADRQRLQAWTGSLRAMSEELQAGWRRAGEQALAQQQAMTTALEKASAEFNGLAKAAAGVIAQLREEMSGLDERDNVALHERKLLLEQLRELLQTVNAASEQQRAGTEALLASASSALAQAGMRFAGLLEAQSTQAADTAAHVAAGAVELAAVAEAFAQGVQQFQTGNDKLVESLERMEASLRRSTARSDEQLAYYVAQAREVIDLSIASQQGLVENLRALHVAPIKTRPAQGERA